MYTHAPVYLDYAATAPVCEPAKAVIRSSLEEFARNPSSIYATEEQLKLLKIRESIAGTIHASADEIFFTSGGTESDNWALQGIVKGFGKQQAHVVVSGIEHHAILNTCKALESEGTEITFLTVDQDGKISLEELKRSLKANTVLVSIMAGNNEIGTIQDLKSISHLVHKNGTAFHTDAVQAYGHIPMDVESMGIDLMSASGHKFGGPKGTGFLYIKKGIQIQPLIYGGKQEKNLRAGTENLTNLEAMAAAAVYSTEHISESAERIKSLRNELIYRLRDAVSDMHINGSMQDRLPGNINVAFPGIRNEDLVRLLALKGIYISSASACMTGIRTGSHVLKAIGADNSVRESSIRISLGNETTEEEVIYASDVIIDLVRQIRQYTKRS